MTSIRTDPAFETPLAILGGGVAGLSLALALARAGTACRVFERSPDVWEGGIGFILLPDGLAALDRLGLAESVRRAGNIARRAEVRSPQGELCREKALPEHVCIQRRVLLQILLDELPEGVVRQGVVFESFETGAGGNRVARFEGGEACHAAVYVGADGKRSRVREALFPAYHPEPTTVTELINSLHAPAVAEALRGRLVKFEDERGGLAVGLASVGEGRVVWYVQFDVRAYPAPPDEPEAKERFARALVQGWADPFPGLLRRTDFQTSYLAEVVGMRTLPRLHDGDAVLLGDAAHPLPTLLGQGANAAVCDALALADALDGRSDPAGLRDGLACYTRRRLPEVEALNREGQDRVAAFSQSLSFLSRAAP